jgi:hypothetical protein
MRHFYTTHLIHAFLSRNLIRPSLQGNLDAVTNRLSQQVAQSAANSPSLSSILATSPQTIVSPVSYTINNLVPFDQPVATAATFAGMLYQLILGFFVVMISFGAREASGLNRTLSTKDLIILRLCSSFFAYFIISVGAFLPPWLGRQLKTTGASANSCSTAS